MRHLFVFSLVLSAAAGLQAQQPAQQPARPPAYALPPVEVTAQRGAAVLARTGRAARLDTTAFEQTAAQTLADVLARRGGAFVRAYGPGGLASVSLRGTGAAQTLVLLDGFPLADPQLGQADLSLIPTPLIARADVLHGAASAWHGTSAMGGVIALDTRVPRHAAVVVGAEAGAFGLRGVTATAEHPSVRVDVVHRQQQGNFPFQLGEERALRRNADLRQTGALVAGRWRGHRAGLWLTQSERGLPGAAGTRPRGERQHDRTARAWWRHGRGLGRGVLEAGAAVQAGALRYLDPSLGLDETGRTWAGTAQVRYARQDGPVQVGGGVEAGVAHAAHPSLAEDARDVRGSAFGFAERFGRRLHASLALRADAYVQPGRTLTALSPRAGVAYAIGAGLEVMASGGRSFRVPTFNDRYWQPGGNPDLRPERGWTGDVGVRWQRAGFRAELTAFALAVRDQIVWEPLGSVWQPRNVGRVRTFGAEASAEWQGRRVPLYGGVFYTRTDTRDRTAPGTPAYGQPLRYVPREMARLHAGAAAGALAVDVGLRYTGLRYVQADGRGALGPHAVVDAQARYRHAAPGGTLDAALVLENALDARYSVLQGYPMPPRHVRLRLGYTWRR